MAYTPFSDEVERESLGGPTEALRPEPKLVRYASAESVERLQKHLLVSLEQFNARLSRFESKVIEVAREVRTNAAPGTSNADYATPIKKPYHNHHEHEWLACGGSSQGGSGGPSVSTKEWACYCGATKKEVVTEPKRANI